MCTCRPRCCSHTRTHAQVSQARQSRTRALLHQAGNKLAGPDPDVRLERPGTTKYGPIPCPEIRQANRARIPEPRFPIMTRSWRDTREVLDRSVARFRPAWLGCELPESQTRTGRDTSRDWEDTRRNANMIHNLYRGEATMEAETDSRATVDRS